MSRPSLSKIQTSDDLFAYLSWSRISFIAAILLGYWCLTPLAILAYRHFLPAGDAFSEMLKTLSIITFWRVFLVQVGILGLIVFTTAFIKYCRQSNEQHRISRGFVSHALLLALFVLLLWSLVSALLSDNLHLSMQGSVYRREGWLTYLFYAGIFCLGYLLREPKHQQVVLDILIGSGLVLVLLDLISSDSIYAFWGLEPRKLVFFNINHAGYFLCLIILLCAGRFVQTERLALKLIRYIAFIALSAALILNTSLGPYLAVCFGLLLFLALLVSGYKDRWKSISLLLVGFIVLSVVINLFLPRLGLDLRMLSGDLMNIFQNNELAATAGSKRWLLWTCALAFIIEKPIFGFGPDNLGDRYGLSGIDIDRPHNEPLQIASSLGLPALILYLGALGYLAFRVIRHIRTQNLLTLVLFISAAGYFVSSLFGNSMFYTTPFFMLVLGMLSGQVLRQSR